jgi:hypothetical protein
MDPGTHPQSGDVASVEAERARELSRSRATTDASRLKQALTDLREGIPATQWMLQAAAPVQRIAGSSQPVGAKLLLTGHFAVTA